ncbi:MAG TPA: hypothetical protein VGW33_04515 [Terriglobia bacterium]|nr:hypothetical protein [Terriglobia bacterium]
MKKRHLIFVAIFFAVAAGAQSQPSAPLKFVRAIKLPAAVKGNFDHFGVDLKGHRLFATPEDYKAALVFDLRTGKLIHTITGIGRPHAILYRPGLDRLYVTDGDDGAVKIFNATTYHPEGSVKLLVDTDSIGYDPATHYLYIDNGGGDAHQTYSMLSVVDTTAATKLADIKIDGDTLEAMALEPSNAKLYVNNKAKNQVDVIDRATRKLVASWPVTKAKTNVAMAFDEAHHRLFVGCRSGAIVVFNTETGKELDSLPIVKGVDDMVYDAASHRIYASGDGAVDVYEETDPDHYKMLGKVTTGQGAKTSRLVPELHRFFVAVPQHGSAPAEILEYEVL